MAEMLENSPTVCNESPENLSNHTNNSSSFVSTLKDRLKDSTENESNGEQKMNDENSVTTDQEESNSKSELEHSVNENTNFSSTNTQSPKSNDFSKIDPLKENHEDTMESNGNNGTDNDDDCTDSQDQNSIDVNKKDEDASEKDFDEKSQNSPLSNANHTTNDNSNSIEDIEMKDVSNEKDQASHYQNGKNDELDDSSIQDESMDSNKPNDLSAPTTCEKPFNNSNNEKAANKIDENLDNSVTVIDSDDDEDPLKGVPGEEFKLNIIPPKNLETNTYVIHSDSDSEGIPVSKQTVAKNPINNDDDDVVLIDDDDDDKPSITPNIQSKLNNEGEVVEEPPLKKMKIMVPNDPNLFPPQSNNLSIKEARSLSETNILNSSHQPFIPNVGVHPPQPQPVALNSFGNRNIRAPFAATDLSATNQLNQMAKLNPSTPMGTTGPILGINPNLLPALTDDMFVLEAPSFIVPYIYEKPPTTNLKETIEKIKIENEIVEKNETDETAAELEKLTQIKTSENVENESEKKGKKSRKAKLEGDDSWDESEESDDEDSSDENRTKVLIKDADTDLNLIKQAITPAEKLIAATQPPVEGTEKKTGDSYFESPLGRFFIDIGIDLVQGYVQADLLKVQKRKLRKTTNTKELAEIEISIAALSKNLEVSRKKNNLFHFELKRCEFCNFKTESALVMAHHYETPHMDKNMYKCNFCSYEVRQTAEILFHMEAVHNIKGRLEKALCYHQCPNCPFEDNGRSKLARHQPVCVKKFRPESNLCPPNDWEAPAKIPKIKPKHGLVGTATAYQAMAAQAAAQKAALATLQQQQQAARNLLVSNNMNRNRKPPPPLPKIAPVRPPPAMHVAPRPVPIPITAPRQPLPQTSILPNPYNVVKNNQMVQAQNQKRITGQPSISITPLPRQVSAPNPSVSAMNPSNIPKTGMKPGPPGNKSSFVICEICDGYIKDLEQLRNHMQWMHKVKIHPKMIFNRPPLNCQKCQFRFFTDQGLERHLLGSHGLVTSSMQDAANKGKDAGRCPVCGRVYQWKLLNHVSRDHNMTLKPAHLSYKCTVCTATFGMYKEFENHVYTAHSTVAKKSIDMKKGNNSNNSSNNVNPQRPGGPPCNDALLKPLRINDEITIIPQGSTKKI